MGHYFLIETKEGYWYLCFAFHEDVYYYCEDRKWKQEYELAYHDLDPPVATYRLRAARVLVFRHYHQAVLFLEMFTSSWETISFSNMNIDRINWQKEGF